MNEELSRIPRTDDVVRHPALQGALRQLGARLVTDLARQVLASERQRVREGASAPTVHDVALQAAARAARTMARQTRRVINATGVVLHTNLGRAPLSEAARDAVAATACGYVALEIDLESGRRGGRGAFAESALVSLSGAEAALVVNNCAAAVLLALSAIAAPALEAGKTPHVIVSRGELIEIGGGFRVPEVLERSGARLLEVGTTNRTKLEDYARALERSQDVVAVLRVHQGNFRQIGFVERPPLAALGELAHKHGVPLVKDLGGGALVDFEAFGLRGEPTVRSCVEAGAGLVCFSTDKALGGPQGGVLVGRTALVERARRDPLARAMRLGRMPLAALEATLAAYLAGDEARVPTIAALAANVTTIEARAERWAAVLAERGVAARVVRVASAVGGGALAEEGLESAALAIAGDVEELARRLRMGDPAVLGRVRDGELLLDGRTVLPFEEDELLEAVARAARTDADVTTT